MAEETQEILCMYTPNAITEILARLPLTDILMLLEFQPRKVVQRSQQQDLLYFGQFDSKMAEKATSGRIFHQQLELRWEIQGEKVGVVYTGTQTYRPLAHPDRLLDLNVYQHVHKAYYLFGTRLSNERLKQVGPQAQPGDFAEVRIPRLLRYPPATPANTQRVQIVVREYIEPEKGMTIAFRFVALKGAR